jgi:hypothetical protein
MATSITRCPCGPVFPNTAITFGSGVLPRRLFEAGAYECPLKLRWRLLRFGGEMSTLVKPSMVARRLRVLEAGAALAMALVATDAMAAPYKFTFTGGNPPIEFFVDDTVTPYAVSEGEYFGIQAYDGTIGGAPAGISSLYFINAGSEETFSSVQFYTSATDLTFNYLTPNGQLYTGSESSPTFKTGTFFFGRSADDNDSSWFSQVTISRAGPGAPGPLAGVGFLPALAAFGALGATRFRRRNRAGPKGPSAAITTRVTMFLSQISNRKGAMAFA